MRTRIVKRRAATGTDALFRAKKRAGPAFWISPAAIALALLATTTADGLAEPAAARPNILVLLTDDQRWDAVGCAGNPIVRTPEMDRLAAEGTRFVNALVTS